MPLLPFWAFVAYYRVNLPLPLLWCTIYYIFIFFLNSRTIVRWLSIFFTETCSNLNEHSCFWPIVGLVIISEGSWRDINRSTNYVRWIIWMWGHSIINNSVAQLTALVQSCSNQERARYSSPCLSNTVHSSPHGQGTVWPRRDAWNLKIL